MMTTENIKGYSEHYSCFLSSKTEKAAASTLSYQKFLSFFFPEYGHFLEPKFLKRYLQI